MRKHPVSKFIGLTVLYAAVIIGIFVLQFKAESVISKSLGALRVSLYQTEDEDGSLLFKNQFQVSFKGLTFSGDQTQPVTVLTSDRKTVPLQLKSYTEPDELSIELDFTDSDSNNIALLFAVTDDSQNAELYMQAKLPSGIETLSLPYRLDKTLSIDGEHQTANRIVTVNKNSVQALTAHETTDSTLVFARFDAIASYTAFDPAKRFTFEELAGLEGTEESLYNENIRNIRAKVITLTTQLLNSVSADNITESQVSAYVAEMSANGKWNEALEAIPDAFRKGNRRTYVTAPYFDNLVNMNRSLVIDTDKYASITQSAIENLNLDIFAVQGMEDYILREKYTTQIHDLLSIPSRIESFDPDLSQCAGIISMYANLYSRDKKLASLLEGSIQACTDKVMASCSLTDGVFALNDSDSLTVNQKVMLGMGFVALGSIQQRQDFTDAGRIIFNQAVNTEQMDLRTVSDLYPLVARDNTYYPHTLILGYYGTKPVWAWTCASDISYKIDEEGVVNLNITFPLGFTHYIFFNGVPTFHSNIEIQRQMFRSDPRFESYNSSGYVYQNDTETLFIKSRQKSQTELIRLFCDPADNFRSTED